MGSMNVQEETVVICACKQDIRVFLTEHEADCPLAHANREGDTVSERAPTPWPAYREALRRAWDKGWCAADEGEARTGAFCGMRADADSILAGSPVEHSHAALLDALRGLLEVEGREMGKTPESSVAWLMDREAALEMARAAIEEADAK